MKIISNLLCAALLFTTELSFCQAPVLSWQHAYGGSSTDIGYDLQKTADGGLIMAGYTESHDGDVPGLHGTPADYYIVKLDASQNIQWTKNLGGTGRDEAFSIRQTTDGGFIVAGLSESNDGDVTGHHDPVYQRDFWIVKLNASGSIVWQKSLGGTYTDIAHCIQQTTDGGYIVAGETFSFDGDVSNSIANGDYWIVKLDAAGNISWEKTYGGISYDVANYIQQTKDGGYIIGGTSNSTDDDVTGHHGTNTTSDYWIVKINATGALQWQKSLGGTANDVANCIRQTKDGGFLVAGSSASSDGDVTGQHGDNDMWLVKLSAYGNIKWQHAYGGSGDDNAYNLEPLTDGAYIISGSADSKNGDVNANHGGIDYWVLKINSLGVIQWGNTYGGSNVDVAYATRAMPDGSYFTAGYTGSYDQDAAGNHGASDILLLNLGTVPLSNTIATTNISPKNICWEQPVSVDYVATGSFNPGNIFTAQLSDNNGGFVNLTPIGSVTSVTSGSISCFIPSNLKKGSPYYIRVVSSNPLVTGGAYPALLKLKCDAPDGLKTTNITSSSATLSWKAASCPLKYVVRWKLTNGNNWDSTEVTSTTATITGLLANTMYDWRVKELCSDSPELFSDLSKKKSFTTAPLRLTDESNPGLSAVIEVYPNPANNILNITCSGLFGESQVENEGTMVITNLIGEVVLTQPFNSPEIRVNVSQFDHGVYLLQLKSSSKIVSTTFVKE